MGPIFKDQADLDSWPLKTGTTGWAERSVTNYISTLRQHPRRVNISIIVLHTNSRGRLKKYEFYSILNVIYVISVNDNLEPQSNDWSQWLFGSFRVNERPLFDIKFVGTSWLKSAVRYLYIRSFSGYSPTALAHILLRRKQLPFTKLKELTLTHFSHNSLLTVAYIPQCMLSSKWKIPLKTLTSMENFHLALYCSEYLSLRRLTVVFTHTQLPTFRRIVVPRKISDCFPCYTG